MFLLPLLFASTVEAATPSNVTFSSPCYAEAQMALKKALKLVHVPASDLDSQFWTSGTCGDSQLVEYRFGLFVEIGDGTGHSESPVIRVLFNGSSCEMVLGPRFYLQEQAADMTDDCPVRSK